MRTQHSPAQFSPNLVSWAIIPFPIIDESLLFSLSSRSLINTPFSSSIYLFCSIENGFPSLYSNTHTHTHTFTFHTTTPHIYTHTHPCSLCIFVICSHSVPHFFLPFSSHQHFHADASSISTLLSFNLSNTTIQSLFLLATIIYTRLCKHILHHFFKKKLSPSNTCSVKFPSFVLIIH